ncbi:MAG: RNA-binding cell elongation regulator Jag/EloR [Candidatus Limnocylindrales bacterium]
MSDYQEFTGKSVEEALKAAREAFGVAGLDDLDFEILTPGSRGVLGMGAEPARIVAAPRSALGGAAPRREAAAATPLPPREPRPEGAQERGRDDRSRGGRPDRGPRPPVAGRSDRPPTSDRPVEGDAPASATPPAAVESAALSAPPDATAQPPRRARSDRPPRSDRPDRAERPRPDHRPAALTEAEAEQVAASRASRTVEREEIQAAEASPEALAAGQAILQRLLALMGYDVQVNIVTGATSKLDVTGEGDEREALGALIGRKGERLSALQHVLNLMLSREVGAWTRVLVDVEDYRGRRERQLVELANRAADHVLETGKMLQLEPMPPLERRWIHIALKAREGIATQSIGEEPNRRVVVLHRDA